MMSFVRAKSDDVGMWWKSKLSTHTKLGFDSGAKGKTKMCFTLSIWLNAAWACAFRVMLLCVQRSANARCSVTLQIMDLGVEFITASDCANITCAYYIFPDVVVCGVENIYDNIVLTKHATIVRGLRLPCEFSWFACILRGVLKTHKLTTLESERDVLVPLRIHFFITNSMFYVLVSCMLSNAMNMSIYCCIHEHET